MDPIPINLAVEDPLSDAVARKILSSSSGIYEVGVTYSRGGFGYLKSKLEGFNNAAKGTPFFVLTDLDVEECAPKLRAQWLPNGNHPNLVFRIAVREVESWLLADLKNFSAFLGIKTSAMRRSIETIKDPKDFLIRLASKSPRREIRADIVPPRNSARKQGPNYNGRLIEFVEKKWNPIQASRLSDSLDRAIKRLDDFSPVW